MLGLPATWLFSLETDDLYVLSVAYLANMLQYFFLLIVYKIIYKRIIYKNRENLIAFFFRI